MDLLTTQLLQQLAEYGPWLLFALAVLETSFVTGLVVPSGLATSVGTVLALEGTFSLSVVVVAAASGGFVGDTAGYWIGRVTRDRVLSGEGKLARLVGRRQEEAGRFFGRHPVYSVTVARLVSFVRTLMPMAAGISGIAYPRFLAYEILGLAGWVTLYVGIGALAQESWEGAVRLVGVGGAVAFAVTGIVLWTAFTRRRRRKRSARIRTGEGA